MVFVCLSEGNNANGGPVIRSPAREMVCLTGSPLFREVIRGGQITLFCGFRHNRCNRHKTLVVALALERHFAIGGCK
jgi:hypothetical protein